VGNIRECAGRRKQRPLHAQNRVLSVFGLYSVYRGVGWGFRGLEGRCGVLIFESRAAPTVAPALKITRLFVKPHLPNGGELYTNASGAETRPRLRQRWLLPGRSSRRNSPVSAWKIRTWTTTPTRSECMWRTPTSLRLRPGRYSTHEPPGATAMMPSQLRGRACLPGGLPGIQTRHSPGGGR